MAKKDKSPERKALDAFDAKYEGKTLTDAQEAERDKLVDKMGAADFVRIAEKKTNSILRQAEQLAKMAQSSRYRHTPEQVKTIKGAVEASFTRVFDAFAGKAAATQGIKLG